MAKRKSAALFEVIHSDKRFPKRHGWTIRAPKWFTRHATNGEETASPRASSGSTPWRMPKWVPSLEKLGLKMDPDRQIVRFQLTYTGALVSAFTLVVLVALVYVLGKHTGARPMPALAEATTDELRNGPITPEVLDVGVPTAVLGSHSQPPNPRTQQPPANTASGRRGAINEPKPPTTFVEVNSKRSVGMQFVIVQSYPPEERQLADEAMQLLCKNGLPCSVEYNLRFAPGWYSVVGYTGFSSTKNSREYNDYLTQIQSIGERFGGGSKFKKFKPMPFTWTERKPADAQPPARQ